MQLKRKRTANFMLALQTVGAVFVGIFLAAYLGGMLMNPSTAVLHFEPAFRISLATFGVVLLVLLMAAVVIAVSSKNK
jgi:hypothetical protein